MTKKHRYKSSDRIVRVLRALQAAPTGHTLEELVLAIGESGRKAHAATVTMLLRLRDERLVLYTPGQPGAARRPGQPYCRPPGNYRLAPYGAAWLKAHGMLDDPVDEEQLETGAMKGETRTIVQAPAVATQVPENAITSVFDLGRLA